MVFKDKLLELKQTGKISFINIRKIAEIIYLELTKSQRDDVYSSLKRGKKVLNEEIELYGYLHSYGIMHYEKMISACETLPRSLFDKEIEIYDWGCGQALATICLFDYLRINHISNSCIKKITLIEPSEIAVNRGKELVQCYTDTEVNIINKKFDDLTNDDLQSSSKLFKIHLFSNILDVTDFDIADFTEKIQTTQKGKNIFVCVGPYYNDSRRIQDFMTAIAPSIVYAEADDYKWKEWTRVMRVFAVNISTVESNIIIRQRIEDSKKQKQFYAGYILDFVSDKIRNEKDSNLSSKAETLLKSLSVFNVYSNKSLEINKDINPKWAVINNIITRGLPTIAPIELEKYFEEIYKVSRRTDEKDPVIHFNNISDISFEEIFEALHIVDPRFDINESYNRDILESNFEKKFIFDYLKSERSEFLAQVLEPQRKLSTIIKIPDRNFSKDQRVDFSLDIPYYNENSLRGFILEIDGKLYHSDSVNILKDRFRDELAKISNWDTYRITDFVKSVISEWKQTKEFSEYINIISDNYDKKLEGKWLTVIISVLVPFAVARIQKIIVESILSGKLQLNAESWKIIVYERDVPCSAIAFNILRKINDNLNAIIGIEERLPEIDLSIISTDEFINSPLHLGIKPTLEPKDEDTKYDLCIDISMLLKCKVDKQYVSAKSDTYYLIRSSHFDESFRMIYTSSPIKYKPFVKKDNSGNYINIDEREKNLLYFVHTIFRKTELRTGQLPIISKALEYKTTIGLLPTGGGKSLTYQLACMLQPGVAIVIDPLKSLMTDQYNGLLKLRIDFCSYINSTQTGKEKSERAIEMSNGKYLFMYMSPERFMIEGFRASLNQMTEDNHVYFSYGVIDEVHCVSEWGHDFRTAYLHLGRNMSQFMQTKSGETIAMMGLTATASFDVLADVERELTVPGRLIIQGDAIVRPEEDKRPELSYEIVKVKANFDSIRDERYRYVLNYNVDEWKIKECVANVKRNKLLELLKNAPDYIEKLNILKKDISEPYEVVLRNFDKNTFYKEDDNECFNNAGIIFCPHKNGSFGIKTTNGHISISDYLKEQTDYKISTFVGGDDPDGDMKDFLENETNVMVSTKAFGMGIDKPNVRFTININHPSSVESFVQEAGRAGRDRKNAIGYIIFEDTKYVILTYDLISIRLRSILNTKQLNVLNKFNNRIVLLDDIPELCEKNGLNSFDIEEIIQALIPYSNNVDKDIELFFHNNAFKGEYKEKVIMLELVDEILNVIPTNLTNIQGQLRELCGEDNIRLSLYENKQGSKGIKVVTDDGSRKSYGLLFLNNLFPYFKFADIDLKIGRPILEKLIFILKNVQSDHLLQWLNMPDANYKNLRTSIYKELDTIEDGKCTFVNISWKNILEQDLNTYASGIIRIIINIVDANKLSTFKRDLKPEDIINITNYDILINIIEEYANYGNLWWHLHAYQDECKSLLHYFSSRRTKDDTDKAIYRMCCIGLIEDVTIDYNSEIYTIKIKKRRKGEYYNCLKDFLMKYFSAKKVKEEMIDIDNRRGRNEIDKAMGFLTEFIYRNTEKKRLRAIDDMIYCCNVGMRDGRDALKEFIHLYFNSKYARIDYNIDDAPYSLTSDTENNREFFEDCEGGFLNIVNKYIDVIGKDDSGTEIENVKHLNGASMLILRTHVDNGALNLIKAYCIMFLGIGENKTLREEAYNAYDNGFYYFYEHNKNNGLTLEVLFSIIDEFNKRLVIQEKDNYIFEELINEAKERISLAIHAEWFKNFTNKYKN